MLSAFGVDHGEVSKAFSFTPPKMKLPSQLKPKNPGGARRAGGPPQMGQTPMHRGTGRAQGAAQGAGQRLRPIMGSRLAQAGAAGGAGVLAGGAMSDKKKLRQYR